MTWDGECYVCWSNGRRDVVPGHLYELREGHWTVTMRGPRPLAACPQKGCTMSLDEHAREGLQAMRAMLAAIEERHMTAEIRP